MATDMAARRLRKELMAIRKDTMENIEAAPLENNILEWHFVITGTKGSPYEGGYYHGKVKFPSEYPLKPPSMLMFTPNGRFAVNRRLCLSMSDFHPETWNPMWSVSTILMGMYSFMLENTPTLGSISTNHSTKRRFAAESLAFNCKDATFCKLFPHLVELNSTRKQAAGKAANGVSQENGHNQANADAAAGAANAAQAAPKEGDELGATGMIVCGLAIAGVAALLARALM